MEQEDLNSCLIKLQEAIDGQLDEKVLRYCNQYLLSKDDSDIMLCKVVSMIRLDKHQQALQVQKGIKEPSAQFMFLKAYTNYKLKNYSDSERDLGKADANDLNVKILKSQLLNKKEFYGKSADILADIIVNTTNQEEISFIFEDLCSNFFNSLSMLIWVNFNKGNSTKISPLRKEALDKALEFCLKESEIREVLLNLCILLAIDLTCRSNLLEAEDHLAKRKQALSMLKKRLEVAKEEEMDAEEYDDEDSPELTDIHKDNCIVLVLETIFQVDEKSVRVVEKHLEEVQSTFQELSPDNLFLKACLLSYSVYLKTGSESNPDLNSFSKQIDTLLKSVKPSNISKEMKSILEKHLKYNKAITSFMRGRYNEIHETNFSLDKTENALMRHFVLIKRKDMSALEKIHSEISGTIQDQIKGVIMQIAVYNSVNNQKKYIQYFKQLFQVSLLVSNFIGILDS